MSWYCGNNRNDPALTSGEKKMGTRYICFRRGVGIGKNLPLDPAFSVPYDPIDNFKIYCGKKTRLPPGYDRMGSLSHCLQKGVGVGKSLKARSSSRRKPRRKSTRKPRRKSRKKKSRRKKKKSR